MSQLDPMLAKRLAALSAAQRELLAVRLAQRDCAHGENQPARPPRGAARLMAFVVPRDGSHVDTDALRTHLESRLPPYMVPQGFTAIEALPRTSVGKVDRRALTQLSAATEKTDVAHTSTVTSPSTDAERALAAIWCDVLGLSEVGVDEDFFELGGDSLLSIRILARANQQGLRISPEDFFAKPTVAGQAAVAGAPGGIQAERGLVTGAVPLTPIQHWFFERIRVDPQHWNQSFLFRLARPLDLSTLERAVQALLVQHDALRIEFEDGSPPAQFIREPQAALPVSELDLRELAEEQLEARIEMHASELNASFDLCKGPLLRVVLVRAPEISADRLLILAHHLVVDALSWRLLLEDLERAYEQAERGADIALGAKTSSFKRWAGRLVEHAQSEAVRAELEHWRVAATEAFRLPVDHDAPADANRFATLGTVTTTLGVEDTQAVLRELPTAFRSRINEVLLAALAIAMQRWSGVSRLRLDLEGHGRDALFDDLDVSRTIGWFTTVYPVTLLLPLADDAVTVLMGVKEQLRAIPAQGIGYGLLRELTEDRALRETLRGTVHSGLLFNYLGQVDRIGEADRLLVPEGDACGMPRSPKGTRAYLVEINARVLNADLEFQLGYSKSFHRHSTIATLANEIVAALRALVAAAREGESSALTPSDFPLADLDQADLDGLARALDAMDTADANGDSQ